MAPKAKADALVKVSAIYSGFDLESITLWGVPFVKEGGVYFAELDKDTAAEMIEAGRVKAA